MLTFFTVATYVAMVAAAYFFMVGVIKREIGSRDLGLGTSLVCAYAALQFPVTVVAVASSVLKWAAIIAL